MEPETAIPEAPPFAGDPAWKVVRVLRDGRTIAIRPIAPEDREALRKAFHETSAHTRYLRFLGVVGELSDAMLTYLTNVDQKNHVALVATMASPDLKTERGVGVARFIRLDESPDVAEAAITVADDMQRQGVGKLLASELGRAARACGVRVIRAEVLDGNAAMRAILDAAGAHRVETADPVGTHSYDIELDPTASAERGADVPLEGRIAHILRGAAETMALSLRRLFPPASDRSDAAATTSARGNETEPDQK